MLTFRDIYVGDLRYLREAFVDLYGNSMHNWKRLDQ